MSRAMHLMQLPAKKRSRLVRLARRRLGMTQGQLAAEIDTSPERLGRIERGEADLYLSEFVDLCLVMALRPRKRAP
jgi:DNA-binding XRE family transcriptional regulator